MDMCGAWICFHDDTVLLLLLLFAAAVTPCLKAADGRERETHTERAKEKRGTSTDEGRARLRESRRFSRSANCSE